MHFLDGFRCWAAIGIQGFLRCVWGQLIPSSSFRWPPRPLYFQVPWFNFPSYNNFTWLNICWVPRAMVGTGYSKVKKKLAPLMGSLKPEKWSLFKFIFNTQTHNSEKMCLFYWLSRWLLYPLHIGFSNIFCFCYTSVLLKYTKSYFKAKISIICALHKRKGLVHCIW